MKDVVYKVPIDGFQYLRKDGANYYKIASGETHTIIENREMFVTDSIEIVGDLLELAFYPHLEWSVMTVTFVSGSSPGFCLE